MHICYECFHKYDDKYEVCPDCGAIYSDLPKEPIQLYPGTMLAGRYILGRAAGAGGFGIVYKAYDTELEIVVAVKEFFVSRLITRAAGRPEVIVSQKSKAEFIYRRDRFLAEARNMAMFGTHPNIPNVYEFFEENGTAYIVMELLIGQGLNDYLHENMDTVDEDFAIMIGNEVGKALKLLHDKRIVHCDVAPDNIFLSTGKQLKVKLMDLGAAKLADATDKLIDIVLKPGYSPTEQYDNSKNLGPWTDIYALGATLYIMLTGIKPDESTNRKIEDKLVPPMEINPRISENLNNTILKAMAIDRHMRFRNVNEFLQALNSERKVISLAKERKRRKLKRLIGVVGASALVAAGVIGSLTYYNAKKYEERLKPAEITVWYCADEASDEHAAMTAVKDDFERTFEGITLQLVSYPEEEYEDKLREAMEAGELPTLFESTGVSEDILQKTQELDEVIDSEQFQNALFLDQYDNWYKEKRQVPLAIDVPVACVITNGYTSIPYESEYFADLADFGDGEIAISSEYSSLVMHNFDSAFCDEALFLDVQENKSAVLLTSTRDINNVKAAIPIYSKSFVYSNAEKVYCDYTYEWSIGDGDINQTKAAEKLLSWMLGNVYQSYLMISECNEGYIPVNELCFKSKIATKTLKPISEVYTSFVFEDY